MGKNTPKYNHLLKILIRVTNVKSLVDFELGIPVSSLNRMRFVLDTQIGKGKLTMNFIGFFSSNESISQYGVKYLCIVSNLLCTVIYFSERFLLIFLDKKKPVKKSR